MAGEVWSMAQVLGSTIEAVRSLGAQFLRESTSCFVKPHSVFPFFSFLLSAPGGDAIILAHPLDSLMHQVAPRQLSRQRNLSTHHNPRIILSIHIHSIL